MFVGNLQTWGIPVQVQWKMYETFLTKDYNLFWLEEIPVTTICSMKSGKLMTGFPQIHSDWSMDWLIDRLIPYHAIQEVIISALQSEIFGQSVLHHLVAVLASPCAEVTGPKNPLNPRTWNDIMLLLTFLLNGVENPESRKPLSKSKAWDVSHFKDFELRKVFKTFHFWEDRGRPVCSADGRPGGFLFLGSRRRQNLRGQSVDILGPWKVSLKMLRLVAAHIICRCHILYRCNVYIYIYTPHL